MPQNKKHHFVPKFYLRRFSDHDKSINAFLLKHQKKITGANLSNQCYRDYFYGTEPELEHQLGILEGEASRILKSIAECNALPDNRTSDDLGVLLIFVVMQGARTAHFAEQIDELNNRLVQHIFAEQARAEGTDLSKFKVGFQQPAVLAMHFAMRQYPLLMDLEIRLLLNRTDEGFVTSDNPVVAYNQLMTFRNDGFSNIGYAVKGLQIFFPLDDRRMLIFYDADVYRIAGKQASTVELHDRRDVFALNTLQACSATDVVYFRDAAQNIAALYRKAKPSFRTSSTKQLVFEKDKPVSGGRQELLLSSRTDIRASVTFSFMTLRRAAKEWRDKFRRAEITPSVTVRSEVAIELTERFAQLVEEGAYQPAEFFKFLASYG